ncbi:MAG: hypothetical protein JHC87_07240 [Thermoleophilaceae bacterium]|nr:hypothetical protein [Thermoleophilaceae bacterium]
MAQNKTKRKTKHRGTQAGNIESRGRTSRPANRAQAKQQIAQQRQRARTERALMPPTWRGATQRAGIGALILFAVLLISKQPPASIAFVTILMFLIYIPMSFYIDQFTYNRRRAKDAKAAQEQSQKPKSASKKAKP